MSTTPGSVGIVGAGLAGSLMAAMLSADGYDVTVYERRADPRPAAEEGGRSINLALSHRGIRALEGVGIADEVLAGTVPMRGRLMHSPGGELTLQPYGTSENQVIHSVSRSGLNRQLLNRAEHLGAKILFEHKPARVNPADASLSFAPTEEGGELRTVTHDFLVGADGAYSAVRAQMQRTSGFNYTQEYLAHGYKELSMPPAPGGGHAMDPGALHIWPRGGHMMIALPNADGTYTCTLFWPLKGPVSFEGVQTREEIEGLFGQDFPDVPALIPDLVEQYEHNPVGSLVTVRCGPWHVSDRAILIGDAAHAIVPFYGQGMNASFEDCRLLREALRDGPTRAAAFEAFATSRRKDADAIADLALDNYITMRDRVASRAFLLGRSLGRLAHRLMPSVFVPLYTLVTFTSVPYAEAAARWRRQVQYAKNTGLALIIAAAAVAAFLFSR